MDDLLARVTGVPGARRLSRRDVLKFTAGAGLSAAMLPLIAACGGDDDDDDDADPTATTGTGGSTTPTTATGTGSTATTGGGAGATVEVTLADFSVAADPASAAAGTVTFNVANDGAMEHELVVIKTDLAPDALPLNDAGSEVNEDELDVSGEVEAIPAGETKSGEIELTAGKYVLICNVAGHYQAGMRTAFEVM
jgi:uncharacterized cupredoxin-like copper-binding protein